MTNTEYTEKLEADLYNFLEDRFSQYIGSSESLFGADIHDCIQRAASTLENLIANQVEKAYKKGYIDASIEAFNKTVQK